jgi:propanol-preferring alcohol dehydrogenase
MVLERFGQPLQLKHVPIPEIGPDEALIKVAACGLCGTDLEIQEGKIEGLPVPKIMGHEPGGMVEAVGSDVENVREGDHVAVSLYVTCGTCEFCRTNRSSICPNLVGRPGFELPGGFAEYLKMPAENLMPIDPTVPLEQVALLADGVGTSWHAVRRQANVLPGQTAVVMGAGGGLGVHATQAIHLSGARPIAVDLGPEKIALAQRWGADFTVDARETDATAEVLALTDGLGADAVLDFVGKPETVRQGLEMVKRGGTLTVVGLAPGEDLQLDSVSLVLSEKVVTGSRVSSKQDMVKVVQLVEEEKITPVVGARFSLEEANQALKALRAGEIMGKGVVLI